MRFDHLPEISDTENHALDSRRRQQLELPIRKWPPSDFDKSLGNPLRERAQARGQPTGEDSYGEICSRQWISDRINRIHRMEGRELEIAD
jgi:hypothetical protein